MNPEVFSKLFRGEELVLPNIGMETLHHVHADDVAQGFMKAIKHKQQAVGESFNIVSAKALTLRGYAEKIAEMFGAKAKLSFVPLEEWKVGKCREDAEGTASRMGHSPNCSIEKARRLIDYQPGYSSLEAVGESVRWLIENDVIKV